MEDVSKLINERFEFLLGLLEETNKQSDVHKRTIKTQKQQIEELNNQLNLTTTKLNECVERPARKPKLAPKTEKSENPLGENNFINYSDQNKKDDTTPPDLKRNRKLEKENKLLKTQIERLTKELRDTEKVLGERNDLATNLQSRINELMFQRSEQQIENDSVKSGKPKGQKSDKGNTVTEEQYRYAYDLITKLSQENEALKSENEQFRDYFAFLVKEQQDYANLVIRIQNQ